jgi:hypothetical protein
MPTDLETPRDAIGSTLRPASDDLPLFRFRLRQLLIFVSLISLLMAAMTTWSGLTALALLLATLVVTFHVFSTALGTQLRWHANRTLRERAASPAIDTLAGPARAASSRPQTRSPWHQRRSTPLPWLLWLVVSAWLVGVIIGALLLGGAMGHRSSLAGMAVGSFSFGVVAGWFAFVGYSFYGVFRHGLREATNDIHDQNAANRPE